MILLGHSGTMCKCPFLLVALKLACCSSLKRCRKTCPTSETSARIRDQVPHEPTDDGALFNRIWLEKNRVHVSCHRTA